MPPHLQDKTIFLFKPENAKSIKIHWSRLFSSRKSLLDTKHHRYAIQIILNKIERRNILFTCNISHEFLFVFSFFPSFFFSSSQCLRVRVVYSWKNKQQNFFAFQKMDIYLWPSQKRKVFSFSYFSSSFVYFLMEFLFKGNMLLSLGSEPSLEK